MRATVLALAALYMKRDEMDEEITALEAELKGEQKPERIGAVPLVQIEEAPPVVAQENPPEFFGTWAQKAIGYLDHFKKGTARELATYFGIRNQQMSVVLSNLSQVGTLNRKRKENGYGAGPAPYEYTIAGNANVQVPQQQPPVSRMQEATNAAMNYLMSKKGGPAYIGDIAAHVVAVTGRHCYNRAYTSKLLRNTGRVTTDGVGNYRIVNLDTATLAGVAARANAA